MKPSDQDRLLREIFSDATVDHVRETSLARGIGALRGRRRRRTVLASAAASLAVTASLVVALRHHDPVASTPPILVPRPIVSPVATITDEQLLALFPNRSVALVGVPGEQRLLFLDAPQPAASATP
jgi:hypothetical protein